MNPLKYTIWQHVLLLFIFAEFLYFRWEIDCLKKGKLNARHKKDLENDPDGSVEKLIKDRNFKAILMIVAIIGLVVVWALQSKGIILRKS